MSEGATSNFLIVSGGWVGGVREEEEKQEEQEVEEEGAEEEG